MSQPQHISEIMLQIVADPNDPMGKALRRCPFIQAELIKQKKMSHPATPARDAEASAASPST